MKILLGLKFSLPDGAPSVGHAGREVVDGGRLMGTCQSPLIVLDLGHQSPRVQDISRQIYEISLLDLGYQYPRFRTLVARFITLVSQIQDISFLDLGNKVSQTFQNQKTFEQKKVDILLHIIFRFSNKKNTIPCPPWGHRP